MRAREAIAKTLVFERVAVIPTVVLERIARGAGAANWYYCTSVSELDTIVGELRPGSLVSFYFDERIKCARRSPGLLRDLRALGSSGEIFVGYLKENGINIDMYLYHGGEEICELLPEDEAHIIFFGIYPERDDDGVNAITVRLPDADGELRLHPL